MGTAVEEVRSAAAKHLAVGTIGRADSSLNTHRPLVGKVIEEKNQELRVVVPATDTTQKTSSLYGSGGAPFRMIRSRRWKRHW